MYSFYMDKMQLPVAPSKLQLKVSNGNKTITLIDMGEVNILKSPGLSEISFEVMIPQQQYPFAVYKDGFKEASYYLEELERLKLSKTPFMFKVSRLSPSGQFIFDTEMNVALEDYTVDESADNGLDLNVSIRLKQYRDYGTRKYVVSKAAIQAQRPAPEPAKTYVVKSGDTLWGICKKNLGDGSKYAEVAKANGIKNPNLIYPGQVIKLG
ncbi:MAG: LysM peptidoglycan-binding protein [Clostridia bacterium]|nr:LysM peptidoglycan-binding protein [Clostridia bacterium]